MNAKQKKALAATGLALSLGMALELLVPWWRLARGGFGVSIFRFLFSFVLIWIWDLGLGVRAFRINARFWALTVLTLCYGFSCFEAAAHLKAGNPFEVSFEKFGRVHMAFYLLALTPISEELLFRQALMGRLLKSGFQKYGAIVASAALFGLYHLSSIANWGWSHLTFFMLQALATAALGLILGFARKESKSVLAPMVLHALFNFTGNLVFFFR